MKFYFYCSKNDSNVKNILSLFKEYNLDFQSNLYESKSQENLLEKIDGLIIYSKKLDSISAYLMTLFVSKRRYVLFITPDNNDFKFIIKDLKKRKNFSKRITFVNYNNRINNIILKWLDNIKNIKSYEIFNIKYTLRLSGKISDYLNWKAQSTKMTGADWLRQQIQEIMDKDKGYQEFLTNKFKVK